MAIVDQTSIEAVLGRALEPAEVAALAVLVHGVTATLASVGLNAHQAGHEVTLRPGSHTDTVRVFGPLTAVAAVEIDGVPTTSFTWSADGCIRFDGCVGPGQEIQVTCDHGYDPIPADVVADVASRFAAAFRASGIADNARCQVSSLITQKTIGATSVSYATPTPELLEFFSTAGMRFLRFTPEELAALRRRFGRTAYTVNT